MTFMALETDQLDYPSGVCTMSDKIMVCDYNHHRIQIFDERGQFVSTLDSKLDEFEYPHGICSIGENLWVTAVRTKKIIVCDSNGPIRDISLGRFFPRRICSTPQGQALVTTFQGVVLLIEEDSVKKFARDDNLFLGDSGICCNSRGEILITSCCHDTVQVFSEEGELLRRFGERGSGHNQLHSPNGICTDWEDNIFVADEYNNRISIFDPSGVPIQQMFFPGPLDLCMSGNRLVVTSKDNLVGIFSN